MTQHKTENNNTITVEGITFKTSGNIVFSDSTESEYLLAQNSQLDKMENLLENGMHTLLKKLKPEVK